MLSIESADIYTKIFVPGCATMITESKVITPLIAVTDLSFIRVVLLVRAVIVATVVLSVITTFPYSSYKTNEKPYVIKEPLGYSASKAIIISFEWP